MNRWKYQTLEYNVKDRQIKKMHIEGDYQSQLNKLSDDGLKFVGIIHYTESYGRLSKLHFVLKKPE